VAQTRRCFVGDYSAWREGEEWWGDEAVLDAHDGAVKIKFDDEVQEGSKSFCSRLFRL